MGDITESEGAVATTLYPAQFVCNRHESNIARTSCKLHQQGSITGRSNISLFTAILRLVLKYTLASLPMSFANKSFPG